MANTTKITIDNTAWVEVAGSATEGFITNEGSNKFFYREAASLPSAGDNTGHTMELEVGAFVSFALTSGQKVYAKSVSGEAILAITLKS
jgi:hypothetical protein